LLLVIAVVAYVALRDPAGPSGFEGAKALVVVGLSLLLVAAMWIPPVGRALHRFSKR
jgi:hypothetical protein